MDAEDIMAVRVLMKGAGAATGVMTTGIMTMTGSMAETMTVMMTVVTGMIITADMAAITMMTMVAVEGGDGKR
jgi:hypothetical protein